MLSAGVRGWPGVWPGREHPCSSSGIARLAVSNVGAELLKRVPRVLEPELHLLDHALALEEFAVRRQRVFLVFSYPKCRVE